MELNILLFRAIYMKKNIPPLNNAEKSGSFFYKINDFQLKLPSQKFSSCPMLYVDLKDTMKISVLCV